ncbi:hypothetical protein FHR99_002451 [Litorivivens lipolytica]|uniref:Uncharacterized protein n=1 Tax=Litorivivens lipolytica TaxID=1524264 RepID=A0A7W4W7B5_9GAMM|nr:hypothetical protein [Litorivivens lipolytica]MBB3048177.1 hypothetical protein [Litorivivens lipolytica]
MSSWVCRNDVSISVRIKSSVRQIARDDHDGIWDFHKYTYVDTGRLSVTIGSGVNIRETESLPLEDKMREIYRKLVEAHEMQIVRTRQRKIEAEKYETRRRKEQIETVVRDLEKHQVDNLEAFKLQLMKVEENRRFYSAVESHSGLENIEGFSDWIEWSRKVLPTEVERRAVPALQRHQALAEIIAELKQLDPSDAERCNDFLYHLSLRIRQSS